MGPKLINLATVQPRKLEWLWPGRIAIGKLSLVVGEPGLGKSQLVSDMHAIVTTGGLWPDGSINPARGSSILLSAEDDLEDTIVPRLIAAGAQLDRITAMQGVEFALDDESVSKSRCFNLESDLPALEEALEERPDCRLVTIDPISGYLGKTNTHNNAELRGVLAPLAELAARRRVAIVGVTHLNKASESKAMHRVTGSLAFVAAARSAYLVADDREQPGRRLFLPLKNNLAQNRDGLAFTSEDRDGVPAIKWESGAVATTADEALAQDTPKRRQKLEDAKDWLAEILAAGAVEQKSIEKAAAGKHSWPTVRRASDDMRVVKRPSGYQGVSLWSLPTDCDHPCHSVS